MVQSVTSPCLSPSLSKCPQDTQSGAQKQVDGLKAPSLSAHHWSPASSFLLWPPTDTGLLNVPKQVRSFLAQACCSENPSRIPLGSLRVRCLISLRLTYVNVLFSEQPSQTTIFKVHSQCFCSPDTSPLPWCLLASAFCRYLPCSLLALSSKRTLLTRWMVRLLSYFPHCYWPLLIPLQFSEVCCLCVGDSCEMAAGLPSLALELLLSALNFLVLSLKLKSVT